MSLYQIKDDKFCSLDLTSFENEGIFERQDLQRFIKNEISVINPDIMIISEEFGDWAGSKRRIDLLAVDKEANLVVIELKRTNDGGDMDLQAVRYAAMVSNMTWEQAKQAFNKYIENNSKDLDAESKLCEFFGWDSPLEDEFAQDVRIILASANFSKELTNSVLWLNEHDLDVSCVRLSLYKLGDQLVLNAEQIIPLPEAESYQIEVKQKRWEERASRNENRDRSLFSISYSGVSYGDPFKKTDIGYSTVKLLEEKGLINEDIFKFLKEDRSCSFELLKTREEMTEKEEKWRRYRFSKGPELTYNSKEYYVARNWGIDNIDGFIAKIQAKFPKISFTKLSD